MKQLDTSMLLDRYSYDPLTGTLARRRALGPFKAGTPLGTLRNRDKRRLLIIDGTRYSAHRVIWQMVTGQYPVADIDHINGDPTDNRWANLRLCDDSQNQANRRLTTKNTSGRKGVTWNKACGKWQAAIKVRGVNRHLGLFRDLDEAHAAYVAAAQKYFGEFARAA